MRSLHSALNDKWQIVTRFAFGPILAGSCGCVHLATAKNEAETYPTFITGGRKAEHTSIGAAPRTLAALSFENIPLPRLIGPRTASDSARA